MRSFRKHLPDVFDIFTGIFVIYLLYNLYIKIFFNTCAGIVGKFLTEAFLFFLGLNGSLLIIASLTFFILIIRRKYKARKYFKYWIGTLFFLLSVNLPTTYYFSYNTSYAFKYGGYLGVFFIFPEGLNLPYFIGPFGIYLLSIGLFIIGILFTFDTTLEELREKVKNIFSFKIFLKIPSFYLNKMKTIKKEEKNKKESRKEKIIKEVNNFEEDTENKDTYSMSNIQDKDEIPPSIREFSLEEEGISISKYENIKYDEKGAISKGKKEPYPYPPLELLDPPPEDVYYLSEEEIAKYSRRIEKIFSDFNIDVKVVHVSQGPVVTCYEIKPAEGTKISKIVALEKELALALKKADKVRIVAPMGNRGTIGIEVPNEKRNPVTLKEILGSEKFKRYKGILKFVLGKTVDGQPYFADLAKMPHLLVAGRTGAGKSVGINTIIASLLYTHSPEELKFIMIDPKRVELGIYNAIPHLLAPVIYYPTKAAKALEWLVNIMHERNELFAQVGVRNIQKFNESVEKGKITHNKYNESLKKLSYIVLVIDELADLMMTSKKEVESGIQRLAQMGRSVGIHLIVATQRPSVDVITGVIKANIPSRIAFAVASTADSRTILDQGGAESLLGYGDMLFMTTGLSKPIRIQGAFISDEEVEKIVNYLSSYKYEKEENIDFNKLPEDEEKTEVKTQNKEVTAEIKREVDLQQDPLFDEAVRLVFETGNASISMLQRTLNVGYNRAGRLILAMEKAGIVGPSEGSKPRKILISKEEYYAEKSSQSNNGI